MAIICYSLSGKTDQAGSMSIHIVPGDDSNKKAITVKTDCGFNCYGFFWL